MRRLLSAGLALLCCAAWGDDRQVDRQVDRDAQGRVLSTVELRGGLPLWKVVFDPESALPVTETSYENGREAETAQLTFESRMLVRREVHAANGELLYTDTLFRWPDGSLRRVERDGSEGPVAEVAWSYGTDGQLVASWSADEDEHAQGQHRETVYEKGRTEELLAEGTKVLLSRVKEETATGTQETRTDGSRVDTRTLDAKGRVLVSQVTVKDQVVSTRRWSYDEKGRVTQSSVEADGPTEQWTYTYADTGRTLRLTRGGTLAREEMEHDGEKAEVRLYDRGELFLVETWSGGRKVKESFYQHGVVVRERKP